MGTYPWGPHGPQAGAHDVTPNPTPAYVPPPSDFGSGSDWGTPAPSSGDVGGGGGPAYSGPPAPPRPRSYIFAIIGTLICGPFALLFYSIRGMLLVLAVMLGYPVALIYMGQPPGAYEPGLPISIWGNDAVMQPLWWKAVAVSVVCAVLVVMRYNRKLRSQT